MHPILSRPSLLAAAATLALAALAPAADAAQAAPAASAPAASAPASAPAAPKPYARLRGDASGSYTVDADHSGAQFTIGHAGVSLVSGSFSRVSGSYTFDARNPRSDKADITIAVDSIATGVALRDKHLLGEEYFDAARFPTMHFVGTRYVAHGPRSGVLHGELTLRGVTRPVAFRVHAVGAGEVPYLPKPWGGYLSGFVADTVIDRTQFGLDAYPTALSHKVRVRIEIEGVRNAS